MAEIPRKTQKLFGSALSVPGNVCVWGSTAAGTPVYSSDLAAIQTTEWLSAFNAAIVGNRSPVMEEMNAAFLLFAQQIGYILQSGIPQWDAGTTYWPNNFVRVGTDLYVSLTNNNVGNDPTSDTNNWQPYFSRATGPTLAAASVVFDGVNSTGGDARIISSFNVDTVTKNAAGSYTINFLEELPSANYVVTGSCGSEDGQAYGAGDDGVVVGNVTGQGNAVRSATACRVFTINPTNKALVQSGCVSVVFFPLT